MGLPIAAFILGETLKTQAIIGGILVLASTLILTIVDNKAQRKNLAKANSVNSDII